MSENNKVDFFIIDLNGDGSGNLFRSRYDAWYDVVVIKCFVCVYPVETVVVGIFKIASVW